MNYEQLTDGELNKLVAEKVMGFSTSYEFNDPDGNKITIDNFEYQPASLITDAFEVVDKMIADGRFVEVCGLTDDKDWGVFITIEKHINEFDEIEAYDKSLPRAICIAALKAVEGKEGEK